MRYDPLMERVAIGHVQAMNRDGRTDPGNQLQGIADGRQQGVAKMQGIDFLKPY